MEKEEIARKFNINLKDFEAEQKKLAKTLSLKDLIDFNLVDRVAGCDTLSLKNRMIAVVVILDRDMEIIEQQYVVKKINLPYLSGFRAYRELPSLVECYHKIQEQPDVIFLPAHGVSHPRGCGLASHFSLAIQRPTIGVAKKILTGEVKKGMIYINNKVSGAELVTREGSKPIYISPGNLISVNTAVHLTKMFIIRPHKLPEPLFKARKYLNKIQAEIVRK